MLGARISVGARVDEHAKVGLGGQQRRDARAVDTLERTQLDRCRGDGGARVPRADHRVGLTVFHQIDGAGNGGIFLAADALDRGLRHFYHLRGVDDFDPRVVAIVLVEFRANAVVVADEEKFLELGELAQGQHCSGHTGLRSVVAAHGIERNPHKPGGRRVRPRRR